jgi:hypothetical protein
MFGASGWECIFGVERRKFVGDRINGVLRAFDEEQKIINEGKDMILIPTLMYDSEIKKDEFGVNGG